VVLALHTLEVAVVVAVTVQDKELVEQVVAAMEMTHLLPLVVIILVVEEVEQVTLPIQTVHQRVQMVVLVYLLFLIREHKEGQVER
jgi:hypothetical protein